MEKIKTVFKAILTLKNWPVYFEDYFKIIKKPYIFFKLRSGLVFKIRSKTNDRVIFNQIWLNHVYEPKDFEINENDIVLDIGAHIGLFSLLAAKSAPKGKVYALEPSPDNFKLLKENVELNKVENIIPINKAVAGENNTGEFTLSPDDPGCHSFVYGETNREKITVETVNLDNFVKENNINRIDFLKMDCEGAEYEILFSCSGETLAKIDKIAMEYHDMDDFRNVGELEKFLEQRGFKISVKTRGGNMLYARK